MFEGSSQARSSFPRGRKPRHLTRHWRVVLFLFAVLCLSLATLASVAPRILEPWAEAELQRQLENKGVEHAWADLRLHYDLSVEIEDLTLTRNSWSTTLQKARASWRLEDLLQGQNAPHLLELQGGEVRGSLESSKASTRQDRAGSHTGDSVLAQIQRAVREIKANDLQIHVSSPDLGEEVSLEGVSFEAALAPGKLDALLLARCTRGCGKAQPIRGRFQSHQKRLEASLEMEHPITRILPLPQGDAQVQLSTTGVQIIRVDAEHPVEITASHVKARTMFRGRSIQVEAPRFSADLHPGSLSKLQNLHLHQPRIEIVRTSASTASVGTLEEPSRSWVTDSMMHPEPLFEVLDGVLDKTTSLQVHEGALVWAEKDLRIAGIGLQMTPLELTASFAWQGGGFSLTYEKQKHQLSAKLDELPLAFLVPYIPWQEDWDIKGFVSADLTLIPGRDLPPTELPKKLRRRKGLQKYTTRGVEIRGTWETHDIRLSLPALSSQKVRQKKLQADIHAFYAPLQEGLSHDALLVPSLTLSFPSQEEKEVKMNLSISAHHILTPRKPALWFQMGLERTSCQDAIEAIPRGMIPHLRGNMRLRGSFEPSLTLWVDLDDPYTLQLDLKDLPGQCKITDLGEYSPQKLNSPFRHEVTEGVTRDGITVGPGTASFVPLRRLPEHVGASAFLTEEIEFYKNSGFGIGLIKKALRLNLDRGRYVYGGSSVSQQLVKNLFLTREKTLSRKLEEAFIVWKMEEVVSKDRILELYLNCIEFGPNLYGIGRASWHYFKKSATELLPIEGAFLAALKPAPWHGDRFVRTGQTPEKGWWRDRMEQILDRLLKHQHISPEEHAAAAPYIVYFGGNRPSTPAVPPTSEASKTEPEDKKSAPPQAPVRAPKVEEEKPDTKPAAKPEGVKKLRWEDLPPPSKP